MRVIVTGASGFIGGAMARTMLERGESPVCIDSRPSSDLPQLRLLDLTSRGALDGILEAQDTVYHLAGSASIAASIRDPLHDFEANALAVLNVLESAQKVGARVILASSAAVYDANSPMPVAETAPRRPVSPYGAAKLAAEAYAAAYKRTHGLDVRIARLFSVYGEGMGAFALRDFHARLSVDPYILRFRGDGSQVRDLIYVADAVEGLRVLAERGEPGLVCNVAGGRPVTVREVAREVASAMGIGELELAAGPTPPGEIHTIYADITRLRGLGFGTGVALSEGVARTVAWLEEATDTHTSSESAPGRDSED